MTTTYININGRTIEAPKTLPSREFRDAWTLTEDGTVDVDVEKAKEIAAERIYNERKAKAAKEEKERALAAIKAEPGYAAANTLERVKAMRA